MTNSQSCRCNKIFPLGPSSISTKIVTMPRATSAAEAIGEGLSRSAENAHKQKTRTPINQN